MVLDTPRKDCPYVFQKKPTLPSSSRQALRGNDGISRARAESHIAECANARFRPPFFFFVHYPLTPHSEDQPAGRWHLGVVENLAPSMKAAESAVVRVWPVVLGHGVTRACKL